MKIILRVSKKEEEETYKNLLDRCLVNYLLDVFTKTKQSKKYENYITYRNRLFASKFIKSSFEMSPVKERFLMENRKFYTLEDTLITDDDFVINIVMYFVTLQDRHLGIIYEYMKSVKVSSEYNNQSLSHFIKEVI